MFLDAHPLDVAILHGLSLLLLEDSLHLPTHLNRQLQNLQRVLDHVVLHQVVARGVRTE